MDREKNYHIDDMAKYTIKDSVFMSLFSDKKYILQPYKVLRPEKTDITEDDITSVILENILMAGQFNDLGFRVNDRLVILMECQNVWTPNIEIRMLMYMADIYHNYYTENEINLYSTKRQNFLSLSYVCSIREITQIRQRRSYLLKMISLMAKKAV